MFSANTTQVSSAANYIEDVFSTWLYTGNGSTQTITNGIDLAGKGGMVWTKNRGIARSHYLLDTARANNAGLSSDLTFAAFNDGTITTSSTGYSIVESGWSDGLVNRNTETYVSWTFREQPKFFDVVTYTGNGANRTIAHSLGSTPGCIIVKRTDTTGDWQVYHSGLTSAAYSILLNSYTNQFADSTIWNSTAPTSTVFSVGTNASVNASGGTYVAYIFASNAGGFGLTGTDNVITCGSFTTDNVGGVGNASVNLGYEPQYLLVKDLGTSQYWQIVDNMRGLTSSNATGIAVELYAGSSGADANNGGFGINATGFTVAQYPSRTYIYIAIRRGPMKTPTSGTSVFAPIAANAAVGTAQTTNFPIDSQWKAVRTSDSLNTSVDDRLRGVSTNASAGGAYVITSSAGAEAFLNATTLAWGNTGFQVPGYYASKSTVFWNFRRAPGFFDEVCYTGTGSARTIAHNLNAVPELMIVKSRSAADNWAVYTATTGNQYYLRLDTNFAVEGPYAGASMWNSTTPTSSVFSVGASLYLTNNSGTTYVAYLFASCPGVSKVGSYTGTGATQTISCGFTGGARFVLIRRTDSTGDWYVWDSARGMVAGTDPSLSLNTTAAEVNANSVYTTTGGFQIVSTAAGINASGGSYIYMAVA